MIPRLWRERLPKGSRNKVENLPYLEEEARARDEAGRALGVSGKSVDAAEKVLKRATPELSKAVDAGKLAVSRAARIANRCYRPFDRHRPFGPCEQQGNPRRQKIPLILPNFIWRCPAI